ncbi:MAG: histidinol-phosphate transaminase [Blastocatellia bacterium]|nr:histidinol-phosphate transaminase [Blastocatellia bacterium]
MPNPIEKIKSQVRRVSAYTLNAVETKIKINQNENPFDMPEAIKSEVLARIAKRPWSRYPSFVPSELLETLAAFANWHSDGVLAGNGSNELIQALLTVTVQPGVKVVISEPTFTLYRLLVEILGGEVISVPLTADFQYNTAEIEKAAESADIVIICSPNNPTGCRLDDQDLERLLENFSGLVVLDEAYYEFARKSVVELLGKHSNLIVLRTFSKAMALAGLRVGYLLASPELTREIAKGKLPYNVNFFSITAAMVAIEYFQQCLQPLVDSLISERQRLFEALLQINGLKPYPSEANFILTEIVADMKPVELMSSLQQEEILIRDVSKYPMLGRHVRISVGTTEENDLLLSKLRLIF